MPTKREKDETLQLLSIYHKISFLSNIIKHFRRFPFIRRPNYFPPPFSPPQKQHTFSLKLKSIHRQSRRPFHSNILKLSFPFKPKGDSRPLRRSTPEFSCVCRLHPFLPPPPHHHPPRALGGKRMSAPGQARIVLPRVYPAADPFPRDTRRGWGMRRCVRDLWRQTPATLPPPLPPRKRNPLRLAVSRDLPVIARNPEERERQGGQGSKQWYPRNVRNVSFRVTERFCSKVCGGRNPGLEVFGADCTRGWHDGVMVEGCVELVGKSSKWFRWSRYLWSFEEVSQGLERELGLKS